jgi:hypothetical protein
LTHFAPTHCSRFRWWRFQPLPPCLRPRVASGHDGEDRAALDCDRVNGYFHELGKSNGRTQRNVEEIGKSADGRPLIAETFAYADAPMRRDCCIAIQRRHANPRSTTPGRGRNALSAGQDGGADHATHTAIEFAYRTIDWGHAAHPAPFLTAT